MPQPFQLGKDFTAYIDFDNIRAGLKEEDFVAGDSMLNSIWSFVDKNGNHELDADEIEALKDAVESSSPFDRHISVDEAKKILKSISNGFSDETENLFKFLSKLGLQKTNYTTTIHSPQEIEQMLSNADTFEEGLNSLNEENVLGLKKDFLPSNFRLFKDRFPNLPEKEVQKMYDRLGKKLKEMIIKCAQKEGISQTDIEYYVNKIGTTVQGVYITEFDFRQTLRAVIINRRKEPIKLEYYKQMAQYLRIPDDKIEECSSYTDIMELIAERTGRHFLEDIRDNFDSGDPNLMNQILESDNRKILQNAIDERFNKLDEETKYDGTDVDLGNGKIDKPAKQRTGNCWIHASINSLALCERGKTFLENNIYRDETKGLIAVHLYAAEAHNLPAPKGDGIYVYTEKEIAAAANSLSSGDGDITAYALAIEEYSRSLENGLYGYGASSGGNTVEASFNVLFSTGGKADNSTACTAFVSDDYTPSYEEAVKNIQSGIPAVIGIHNHAMSIVGCDENGNLLIQESNLADNSKDIEWLSGLKMERYSKDVNGAPTFVLTKENFPDNIQYSCVYM